MSEEESPIEGVWIFAKDIELPNEEMYKLLSSHPKFPYTRNTFYVSFVVGQYKDRFSKKGYMKLSEWGDIAVPREWRSKKKDDLAQVVLDIAFGYLKKEEKPPLKLGQYRKKPKVHRMTTSDVLGNNPYLTPTNGIVHLLNIQPPTFAHWVEIGLEQTIKDNYPLYDIRKVKDFVSKTNILPPQEKTRYTSILEQRINLTKEKTK